MKTQSIIKIIFLACVIAAIFASCTTPQMVKEQGVYVTTVKFDPDTVTTSGTADTTMKVFGSYFSPVEYSIQVVADSLSGATAATFELQHAQDVTATSPDWKTLSTTTVNGVTTNAFVTGYILKGQLRARIITNGTAQSTVYRPNFVAVSTQISN